MNIVEGLNESAPKGVTAEIIDEDPTIIQASYRMSADDGVCDDERMWATFEKEMSGKGILWDFEEGIVVDGVSISYYAVRSVAYADHALPR